MLLLTTVLTLRVDVAGAVIGAATTIDASSDVVDFGDAAMAPDGTGAIVYRRLVEGIPHVFVARYSRRRWFPPIRVDRESSFAAGTTRIAAAAGGRLLVVWTQAYATLVDNSVRYRLMSATLAPGASGFDDALVVDRDVRAGVAVDPAVAITPTGRAFVAYRVVLGDERSVNFTPLRPGDVLGDVRVAYLDGRTWSSAGSVVRNRAATMRAPNAANGPQVATTPTGTAVVAWQEPDVTTGVARVYARRVFGTRAGNVLAVSPEREGDDAVAEDADGIAVTVSRFGSAVVAFRLAPPADAGPAAQSRLMVNTLPRELEESGARFAGARAVAASAGGQLGVPSVALDDDDDFRLVGAIGGGVQLVTGGLDGLAAPVTLGTLPEPAAVVAAIDPSGGGTSAWPAADAAGGPAVAVRQDFPDGAFQTAVVGAVRSGPINGIRLGRSGLGDALVGFGQGAAGDVQVAGAVVQAPPATFILHVPSGWVVPSRARVSWDEPASAFGGLRYDVAVDGIVRRRGHRGRGALLDPRGLDDGAHAVQVIATDSAGQQVATSALRVRVDGQPPTAVVRRVRGTKRGVLVTVRDAGAGVRAAATRIAFGDGSAAVSGRARARHAFARPGRYRIRVTTRDRVGHRAVVVLDASVR